MGQKLGFNESDDAYNGQKMVRKQGRTKKNKFCFCKEILLWQSPRKIVLEYTSPKLDYDYNYNS